MLARESDERTAVLVMRKQLGPYLKTVPGHKQLTAALVAIDRYADLAAAIDSIRRGLL